MCALFCHFSPTSSLSSLFEAFIFACNGGEFNRVFLSFFLDIVNIRMSPWHGVGRLSLGQTPKSVFGKADISL